MPDIDGFDVAARLTSDAGGPVVILVSSRDSSDFGRSSCARGPRLACPKAELSGDRLTECCDGTDRALVAIALAGW